MSNAVPSHHLLNNSIGLTRLFDGKAELEEVESALKLSPTNGLYFGRWKVAYIMMTSPFAIIFRVFYGAISYFCEKLTFVKTSRIFTVLSNQVVRRWQQLCFQWDFKQKLLVPTYNEHQFSTWNVFADGSLPLKKIEDSKVKKATFKASIREEGVDEAINEFFKKIGKSKSFFNRWNYSADDISKTKQSFTRDLRYGLTYAIITLEKAFIDKKNIDAAISRVYRVLKKKDQLIYRRFLSIPLFSSQRLSRGASLWFIKLFLKSETLTQDVEKRCRAIAEQFHEGVPYQGIFLQGLCNSSPLLKMEKEWVHPPVTLWELDHARPIAHNKFQNLNVGVYRVGVYHHSLVFIKTGLDSGFVFDPSVGLLKMDASELYNHVRNHHYKAGHPDSMISFERYSLAGER